MKKAITDVFVTDDGMEFLGRNEAVQHEQRVRAFSEIEALVFEIPEMRHVRDSLGDDDVNEVLTVLLNWMVTRAASAKLVNILRQLQEGAPAADPGPKGRHVRT